MDFSYRNDDHDGWNGCRNGDYFVDDQTAVILVDGFNGLPISVIVMGQDILSYVHDDVVSSTDPENGATFKGGGDLIPDEGHWLKWLPKIADRDEVPCNCPTVREDVTSVESVCQWRLKIAAVEEPAILAGEISPIAQEDNA